MVSKWPLMAIKWCVCVCVRVAPRGVEMVIKWPLNDHSIAIKWCVCVCLRVVPRGFEILIKWPLDAH